MWPFFLRALCPLLRATVQLFFTGTATEVMPIRSLDKILIGQDGARGPITETLQRLYQDIINGRAEDQFGWMSYSK